MKTVVNNGQILGVFEDVELEEDRICAGGQDFLYSVLPDVEVIEGAPPHPHYDHQWSGSSWEAKPSPPASPDEKARLIAEVNATRDARIEGGFPFMGKLIQSRTTDQINIMTLKGVAQDVIMTAVREHGSSEALEGDYRWLDTETDFAFITDDNSTINLDAFQMIQLFQAGVAFKLYLTNYARALKDSILAAVTTADLAGIDIVNGWP